MKPYVLIALLLSLSASYVWAQTSADMAYHHKYKSDAEAGNEEILVKTFPNPFPEQIQFQFDITEASKVNLTVFDITGNKVAVLVDGVLEKDTYKLGWKPTQHSSGIYVYVFSAGKARKTGKILFLHNRI
jgi:hypothetical protein